MHESRVVADLIQRASEAAGTAVVKSVRVRIGALSHVTPEALQAHWDLFAEATPVSDVTIDVVRSADVTDINAQDVILESITTA